MIDASPAPGYTTIVVEFLKKLDTLLHLYVYDGYTALAHYLQVPLGLAVVLYIVIMGYGIVMGTQKGSVDTFAKSALKIGFIYLGAMHWSWFSAHAVALIEGGANQIGAVLLHATPLQLPNINGGGIDSAMQIVLIEVAKIGHHVFDLGSWHDLAPSLTGVMIWVFGYAVIFIGLFELMLAKIMLAVLFATAPLFVIFTLFKPTQGFFDRWLGACAGFAFLIIFVSAIIAFALTLVQWVVGAMLIDTVAGINLVGMLPMILVCFLSVGMILKVAQLAQSIGGTVTTSSGSAMLAGAVGGFLGASMAVMTPFKGPLKAGGKGAAGLLALPGDIGKRLGKGTVSLVSRSFKHKGGSKS